MQNNPNGSEPIERKIVDRAESCSAFRFDCEEECIDDEISCRNCRYRRWTRDSYVCMKENRS